MRKCAPLVEVGRSRQNFGRFYFCFPKARAQPQRKKIGEFEIKLSTSVKKDALLVKYQEKFDYLNAKYLGLVKQLKTENIWDMMVKNNAQRQELVNQNLKIEEKEVLIDNFKEAMKWGKSGDIECITICND